MSGSLVNLLAILAGTVIALGWCRSCQNTGWEKVEGLRPESIFSAKMLHSANDTFGIVSTCFEKCHGANCSAFILDFEKKLCLSVMAGTEELVTEPNVTFYQRICVKVSAYCLENRLWQVERTAGAVLIESDVIWIDKMIYRSQCYEACIFRGDNCMSAQFKASSALSSNDTLGRCALIPSERGTRPQGYRASMYRDEYLQDQCRNISSKDYCSYAEFRNMTLPYSDVVFFNLSLEECERKCDLSEDGFICRSYSIDYSNQNRTICLLHSEDSVSLGVSSLVAAPNVIYKQREPCLDLSVNCGEKSMTIKLKTMKPFEGVMYASGYAESCGVQGSRENVTLLEIPLPSKEDIEEERIPCGLNPAYSVDNDNRTRTVVWVTIAIQFNPIIQRLGDQAVRVGCTLPDTSLPTPRNVTVQSSFSFLDPNAGVPPVVTTVVNTSTSVPKITMRVLDENNQDALVTRLGQKLILRIEITPVDGPYDIMAGPLVASSDSGEDSYFLLNNLGCPVDPHTFPALLKDPADNRSLIVKFSAFKFPKSQVVTFNVLVKFCLEECLPATCGGGQISYGRRRRSTSTDTVMAYAAEVIELSRNKTPDELPLQLSIIVQSPVISADPLLSGREQPDTVLLAGENSIDGLLCVDASLALSLLIIWLIIQIVLIVGCVLLVGWYKRQATKAEEDRADILARHLYGIHGGNFEVARRVHWADHNSSIS